MSENKKIDKKKIEELNINIQCTKSSLSNLDELYMFHKLLNKYNTIVDKNTLYKMNIDIKKKIEYNLKFIHNRINLDIDQNKCSFDCDCHLDTDDEILN